MSRDSDCVQFLQHELPRMGLRWLGFRRVKRQVCRRIGSRVQQLGLSDLRAYTEYLERNPAEREILESMCGVTISRFYRDRDVFDRIAERILPELALAAGARGPLRVWSAGCASGEEPYSLALSWQMRWAERFAGVDLHVLATDRDAQLIARAQHACYRRSSLRELPREWIDHAFRQIGDECCLQPALRGAVCFEREDIRRTLAAGPFQLILCRNLAFSYFDDHEQRRILDGLIERLAPNGYLVIGADEHLPERQSALQRIAESTCIYRRQTPETTCANASSMR
jgi:chemotaxis protein methyltransferase CheR